MDEEEEEERAGLSPVRAFVVLAIVLTILVGIGLIATSNKDAVPDDQPIPETKNFALTNKQAIARFKQLKELGLRATQQADPSLVSSVFAAGSPLEERSIRIIQELRRDQVKDMIRYESLNVEVTSNESNLIRIRETRKLYPCFVTPTGRDVTKSPKVVRQVIMWEMTLVGSEWRLARADLLDDKRLRANAPCP
jgi:hypothetical protein